MNCWRIQNLVAPFLDGVLPEAEQELFERHIDECPTCEEMVAELADLPQVTAMTLPPEAKSCVLDELSSAIHQRIAAAHPSISEHGEDLPAANDSLSNMLLRGELRVSLVGAATYAAAVLLLAAGIGLNHQRVQDLEGSIAERDSIISSLSQRVVLAEAAPLTSPPAPGPTDGGPPPRSALASGPSVTDSPGLAGSRQTQLPSGVVRASTKSPPARPWGRPGAAQTPTPVSLPSEPQRPQR